MPEIKHVIVATRNPTGDDPRDKGASEEGFYTVDAGLLTMVTVGGAPLRAANGERITARLAPEEDAKRVASRLTLSHWRTQRSRDEVVEGFNRPLHQAAPYGGY
jgi:hypothetical protein